jgi:hypothetical protein
VIRVRGRNGPFTYHHHFSEVWNGGAAPTAYIEIYSNSPHTRTAPVTFSGSPKELIKLFRGLAAELAAGNRAAPGA